MIVYIFIYFHTSRSSLVGFSETNLELNEPGWGYELCCLQQRTLSWATPRDVVEGTVIYAAYLLDNSTCFRNYSVYSLVSLVSLRSQTKQMNFAIFYFDTD